MFASADAGSGMAGGDPSFRRLTWETADLANLWGAKLEASANRWSHSRDAALTPPAILAIAPYQVPIVLRRARELGARAIFLGDRLPDALRGLIAEAPDPGLAWYALVPEAVEDDFVDAIAKGDQLRVARLMGVPDCCAKRASESLASDGRRWDLIVAAPDYRFLPFGISPGRFLPCTPDCRFADIETTQALLELSKLPGRVSARDGVGEFVTPAFRLVFDCAPELDISVELVATDDPSQRNEQYPATSARAVPEARGFGSLRRASIQALSGPPTEALMIPDMAENWPALELWSLEWLKSRFTDAQIAPLLMPETHESFTFQRFVEEVRAGERYYIFSFPFAARAPDMRDDYDVPPCFSTILYRLPSPLSGEFCGEMFLGSGGTTTHLHQDVLETDFWMTVIWGRKRWAICAPSGDTDLLNEDVDLFDPAVREALGQAGIEVLLCEQYPGDTIFMPSRWWHQVENLQPTLAISEMVVSQGSAEDLLKRVDEVESEIPARAAAAFRQAARLALGQDSGNEAGEPLLLHSQG